MSGLRRHHRNRARVVLTIGLVLLVVSIVTEFAGVQWWSSVDLAKLQQTYVILGRGQVVIGQRGTAGFFNRRIPNPGMEAYWPRDYSQESWKRRVLLMTHSRPQNNGFSVPLLSPGILIGGLGCWLYWRSRPPRKGSCPNCGYDMRGLESGRCPECGFEGDLGAQADR